MLFSRSRFTGKERDTESGNDYFGARYYASSMGRFMSPDWSSTPEDMPYAKLTNPQSLNLYSYMYNNPIIGADPTGHLPDLWEGWGAPPSALQSAIGAAATDAKKKSTNNPAPPPPAQQQTRAKAHGRSVTYTYPDGTRITLRGDHPYRDNNPGNEIGGAGAIGKDKGFVIFASAQDGWNALAANLQNHLGDSILDTISARTPPDDGKNPMLKGNDPVRYANAVAGTIGVPASTKLSSLSGAQLNQLAVGIASQEGYYAPGNHVVQ
jgi:RHS repeat-associated protein